MEEQLKSLLLLYAGIILINSGISAVLWYSHRSKLYRALFFAWATTFAGLLIQGAFSRGPLPIVLGFSFAFVHNLAIAYLLSAVVDIDLRAKYLAACMGLALAATIGLHFSGASFFWLALPTALGVSLPLLYIGLATLLTQRDSLTISTRGYSLTCLLLFIHYLDYPVLRLQADMAVFGYTVTVLLIFALSIFAPSAILEHVTRMQARTTAELDVAKRIQKDILPKSPNLPNMELACYMKPAEEVGGDYYDVYAFDDHAWIILGDVTGHGLGSGLVMLMAQSIISSILHTNKDIEPDRLNYLANRILFQNIQRLHEDRSMTVVSLSFTKGGNRFTISGSHDDIYLFRAATGDVEVISVDQNPCGLRLVDMFPPEKYRAEEFEFATNDLLFIGTDGITEAARGGNYADAMFTEERLIEFIKQHATLDIEQIKERLVAKLEEFTGSVFHDDVTFVIARLTPPEPVA